MNSVLEKIRARFASLETWFSRLTQRERVMVSVAFAGTLAFILFAVFFTLGSSAAATRRRTDAKLKKLEQAQLLAANYREAEQARQEAESELRNSNVSLISYLEGKGGEAHLEIPGMSPKGDAVLGNGGNIVQSAVELSLADIKLEQLVDFLTAVERGPGVVKVTSLRIEPHVASANLSAFTTISTYRLKGGT